MRALLPLVKNKSALSNIVAYVLLIVITLSLSVMVYGWLKFYVSDDTIEVCPEGVNIIISDYECVKGTDGYLDITLKNKGLFSVDGYILRTHDRDDAEFGVYTFNDTGTLIKPGAEENHVYDFSDCGASEGCNDALSTLTLVDVQPFILEGGQVSCRSSSVQTIECEVP